MLLQTKAVMVAISLNKGIIFYHPEMKIICFCKKLLLQFTSVFLVNRV